MADSSGTKGRKWAAVFGGGVLAASAVASGLFFLWREVLKEGAEAWLLMATVLLTTIVALVIAFSVIAGVFHWLKMHDQTQALGLPSGSIRALLAFVLIVIFAILAVFFYTNLDEAKPDQVELAKQVTTALVTLVTALAAFYFGARTGQSETDPAIAAILTGLPTENARITVDQSSVKSLKAGETKQIKVTWKPAARRIAAATAMDTSKVVEQHPAKDGEATFDYTAEKDGTDVVTFTLEGYHFEVTHGIEVKKAD